MFENSSDSTCDIRNISELLHFDFKVHPKNISSFNYLLWDSYL